MRALICLAFLACSVDNSDVAEPVALPADEVGPPITLFPLSAAVPGEPLTLRVSGVRANAPVVIWIGASISPGASCPPGAPVCLDLVGATELVRGRADASGAFVRTIPLPEGAPVGATRALQATAMMARSSAVTVEVQDPIDAFGVYDVLGLAEIEIDSQQTRVGGVTGYIARFDNNAGYLLETWEAAPGQRVWNRVDWAWVGPTLYTCTTPALPVASFAAAVAIPAPSRADVTAGGCDGGAWLPGVPIGPAIEGSYTDQWGTSHTIDAQTWDQGWGLWHVTRFSNADQSIIAQNDASNGFFPGLYSRFDWTEQGGDVWYCQTAYDAPTEWAARSTPAADAGDLAAGCGGFGWTLLTP